MFPFSSHKGFNEQQKTSKNDFSETLKEADVFKLFGNKMYYGPFDKGTCGERKTIAECILAERAFFKNAIQRMKESKNKINAQVDKLLKNSVATKKAHKQELIEAKQRKCGVCGKLGHKNVTCPDRKKSEKGNKHVKTVAFDKPSCGNCGGSGHNIRSCIDRKICENVREGLIKTGYSMTQR
jgi:hypothetical protein